MWADKAAIYNAINAKGTISLYGLTHTGHLIDLRPFGGKLPTEGEFYAWVSGQMIDGSLDVVAHAGRPLRTVQDWIEEHR
jgi:hypothetical protein